MTTIDSPADHARPVIVWAVIRIALIVLLASTVGLLIGDGTLRRQFQVSSTLPDSILTLLFVGLGLTLVICFLAVAMGAGPAKKEADRKQAADGGKRDGAVDASPTLGDSSFRQFFEHAGDALFVYDWRYRFIEVNRRACESLGYIREELLTLTHADIEMTFNPSDHLDLQLKIADGFAITAEGSQRRKDGTVFPVEVRVTLLQGADGKPLKLALVRDVTNRRRAEEELRQQQILLRNIIENIPCAVFWKDRRSAYLGCNRQNARDLGFSKPEDLVGLTDHDFGVTHEEAEFYIECDRRVMESGEALINIEETQRRPNGVDAVLLTNKVPLRDASGNTIGILGVYSDITERYAMEKALRTSEDRYRDLFNHSPQPMWVYDPTTFAILAVNEAATRHYGYSADEFLKLTIKDVRPREDVAALLQRLGKLPRGPSSSGVHRHIKKDGTIIEVESVGDDITFDGHPARLVLISDVTEKRRLEEHLRQAQKMEAVGRLAGGVAHDFNNLLTAINGYSELLLDGLEPGSMREGLELIQKAGQRAASLTNQLLAYSRKQVLEPKILDLNAVVSNLGKMLRRLIGEDVKLSTNLTPDPAWVRADPGQLEQVLMNLVVNARDAMPSGGRVNVRIERVNYQDVPIDAGSTHVTNNYVALSVTDTGCGMDLATQSRIFEPFFTTKATGKGTGLGLATVYGIVKQSGGIIDVESSPGDGSTFIIYLPDVGHGPAIESLVPSQAASGREVVLLVEDEDIVRSLVRRVLQTAGYAVLEASDGQSALKQAAKAKEIDLLVTDVVMPGMSGRQLAESLKSERPDLRVLFLSGYTNDAVLKHGICEGEAAFLQKPFTPAALANKVRTVLDRGMSYFG